MQITKGRELLDLENNFFIGEVPKLINSVINFNGKNNMLICEEDVVLQNSRIDFNLENSILYLSSDFHPYIINISIHKNNVCFIGKNNYFNGLTTIVLSEAKNVIIGESCLFSYNVIIRVADGHLIYSSNSKKRLNYSKSIYIGDHVWFGQNAMIFKGTQIGSGSIIGAGSFVSNKQLYSNSTYAGSPIRLLNKDTFWVPHSVHGWCENETEKMSSYESNIFIYDLDEHSIDFDEIEKNLNSFSNLEDILEYIKITFLDANKNRFVLKDSKSRKEFKRRFSNIFD